VLPQDSLLRLLDTLELVHLTLGHVICRSGVVSPYVYFPTSAIISLLNVTEDGATAGIALVGNEGVVGISQFLGGGSSPSQAVVHSAGRCMRVSASAIKNEFNRMGSVTSELLRYTQALMVQMTQTAVCNRHHRVDQQMCRYLLHSLDRVNGSKLAVTQELISIILGVRRESITIAARTLQGEGLIKCTRGHITVLDRLAIERRACECYAVVSKEYSRLFPTFPVS
jgi:CRP-like cAMP-binding protein